MGQTVQIKKITYVHGHTFHDGGWFDASSGKPVIQVKTSAEAAWKTIGSFESYPSATATDPMQLKDGTPFTAVLSSSTTIIALRIAGKPACGDNPNQAFSSCGEILVSEK